MSEPAQPTSPISKGTPPPSRMYDLLDQRYDEEIERRVREREEAAWRHLYTAAKRVATGQKPPDSLWEPISRIDALAPTVYADQERDIIPLHRRASSADPR